MLLLLIGIGILACVVGVLGIVWVRRAQFRALVDYIELERGRQTKCETEEDVRILLAEGLARQAYLLCHRWLSLISRLQECGAVTAADAQSFASEFERYRKKMEQNPYRHESDFATHILSIRAIAPISDELFDQWGQLLKDLEEYRTFAQIYNRLFDIPWRVV